MSTLSNVTVVKELFAAMGRGDLHSVQTSTVDDIEWIVPGDWALAGTHREHAGLGSFFQTAADQVDTVISIPVPIEDMVDQSSAKTVARTFSGEKVVKGFNHLGSPKLAQDPAVHGGKRVVFLASDDADAAADVAAVAEKLGDVHVGHNTGRRSSAI